MNPQVQDEILRGLRNPGELAAWRASQGTKPTTATPASGESCGPAPIRFMGVADGLDHLRDTVRVHRIRAPA